MIPAIYKGSVKDLLGPARAGTISSVVFEYTDAYSVFDWGRMPDPLVSKGASLALLAADWFEKLEEASNWKEFSKTQTALALRKANRFGAAFMETGERLQSEGLRTHFLGVLEAAPESEELAPLPLGKIRRPARHLAVRQVSVERPETVSVLGRMVPDYLHTRVSAPPRLVPLEVVFRFGCPEGSSLLERVAKDAGYMAGIGFGDYKVGPGEKWDFPVLELFTKLESTDRPLTLSEALAISGLSGAQLQTLLFQTAWVAGFIRALCAQSGLELADGKLEWGVSAKGGIFLVDAIGPDELRILKDGVQLSKEFLRTFYRGTDWYGQVNQAKKQAKEQGVADWKRLVPQPPPPLTPDMKELGSQLYMSLCNALTGRSWFEGAWPLAEVVAKMTRGAPGARQ